MKTNLQSTNKTLAARTSCVTRVEESSTLTCHVRLTTHLSRHTDQCKPLAANSEMKQVKRLFPEFFIPSSYTSFAETYSVKTCVNRKLKQRLDEPLIQSWLHLYGGGSQH